MSGILNIYPTGAALFIGQIQVDDVLPVSEVDHKNDKPVNYFDSGRVQSKKSCNISDVETIVILDVSASMGSAVNRTITKYLPNALANLGYGLDDRVKIITFSNQSRVLDMSLRQMKISSKSYEGATYMTPAIYNLRNIISSSKNSQFRILSISDGALHDQRETVNASTSLANVLKKSNYVISSSAIRLFTSSSQPDTKGLSSVLQFNTESDSQLVDVNMAEFGYSDEAVSDIISSTMKDNLGSLRRIKVQSSDGYNTLLQAPWSSTSAYLNLTKGVNTFWLKRLPRDGDKVVLTMNVDGKEHEYEVEVVHKERLGFDSYNSILKDKVTYFMKRLRVLKILGTSEAQNEIGSIVRYFEELEKNFAMNEPDAVDLLKNKGLQSRLKFFRDLIGKKNRSVSMKMSEIANDNKVSMLNSAQQAAYLRSVEISSNSKQLAKRALKTGLNFDEVAKREVKRMAEHVHELDDIDDSTHYTSFYSQETTLGGIRAVCQLVDSCGTIEHVSALDVLKLINIVGVPCVAQVGDYPDPKVYHVTELLMGTCVSMSDVIMVKEFGDTLCDVFTNKEIINTVPFYDDDRIQQFLMKYAPILLEYTASLGVRRIIVDVPHTYKYLIVGGLYNLTRTITDGARTEINVDILSKFITTYKTSVNGIFDYVVDIIDEPTDYEKENKLSYYISNNGVTNMISPLINIVQLELDTENGEAYRAKYIPNILRALFSFETHQVMRKLYRSDSDCYIKRKALLDRLLGINFEKYGTELPPFFETKENPEFYNETHLDVELYNELIGKVHWLDNIVTIPEYIRNSLGGQNDKTLAMNGFTDNEICERLGIDFDLRTFKLYCIVQSFLFSTKVDRVVGLSDGQTDKPGNRGRMKIQDCGSFEAMDKMIRDYIGKQYFDEYRSRLTQKGKDEHRALAMELVDKMVVVNEMSEFRRLFGEGLTRNHVSVVISDVNKLGFVELKDALFDPTKFVPLRAKKLRILVLGVDKNDNVVWNKGNILRKSIASLSEGFEKVGLSSVWDNLYEIYKAKNIHVYRSSDLPNRHSHFNGKPSFWAYGYKNLREYFADISQEEKDEYAKIHWECCGLWHGVVVKPS